MGDKIMMDRARTIGPQIKDIQFRFFPQGTSTTPLTEANGFLVTDGGVVSVTRTASPGIFTVLLSESYRKLLAHRLDVQHVTVVDLKAQLGTISNLASATPISFTVTLLAVATATDMTADANSSVSCSLRFQDSDDA